MPDHDVDLFVIGAGSGGVRAARIAAGYGARVLIAEEYRVGGTCVIRGCVPKKLLVYAARYADDFTDAAGYGWRLPTPTFDWAHLIANKDREIARLELTYSTALERAGVAVVKARAVLEDVHTALLSTGERVRAKHILIATGGIPWNGPEIPGIEHVITSNEAFHLEELPKRILIQGGGYIAVEFAGIFNGLGSEVTLVYRGENILRGFDDDVRAHLRAEMEKRGIKIICGKVVKSVRRTKDAFTATLSDDDNGFEVDKVMFAIGRWPNVDGLGLEALGVQFTRNRGIAVDGLSRSSVPHIYAIGDVTNRINLTPVAVRDGHAFADTVFGNNPTPVDHNNVPTAVFSEPEVGSVGLTEAQATEQLAKVDIYKTSFRPMKMSLAGRDTRAFFKLVVDGTTDRVVGCHIVGPDAGEMIQLAGIAVKMKATKVQFDSVMAVHPTAAEELVTMREKALRVESQAAE
jgi:glutathione reductase (NADPH)